MADETQDSGSFTPIAIGVALLVIAGVFFWWMSTSNGEPALGANAAQKTRRPLNAPNRPAKNQAMGTPMKLPPSLERRLKGPRVVTPATTTSSTQKAPVGAASLGENNAARASAEDAAEDEGEEGQLSESGDEKSLEPSGPKGTLSKESVQAGIVAIKPQIKECFEEGLKHDPSLAGRVTIDFEIRANDDGKGEVVRGEVKDSEVMSPFFEACVLKKVGGQTFEAPQGGGSVRVTYPFNFDPGGGYGGEDEATK